MKKKSNKTWYIIGAVALAFVAFLLVGKKMGWIGKEEASEVEFTTVAKTDLVETVSASGKIQPELEVKISPDVPGEIIGLFIEEGDSVQKGQLLLRIQPENYISVVERFRAGVNQAKASAEQSKSQIARAESQLLRSELDFKRQQKLLADKVISQSDFEVAETNYRIAKQDLEAAKANYNAAEYAIRSAEASLKDASENLRKTNIYAPMSGIVSKLDVELGERVVGTSQMAGTEMLRIANLNNMEVRVNVNENDIVRVQRGDTAIIDVDAYSSLDKTFKGVITQIANTANGSGSDLTANANSTEAVTEFEVRINILPESYSDLLAERRYPFKPGMTATVDIITERKNNVLTVPIAAVTTRSGDEDNSDENENGMGLGAVEESAPEAEVEVKEIVFVNEGGKAKIKEVKTGITDTQAGTIEILEGLEAGEEIISGPYIEVSKRLKDGKAVIAKKEEEKPEKE
ncbi:efflux RND transporter periplasmic adaptor subunit [Jiulongibacter sediminis]|jgi:HlyD family secretion protein|uniref:efflux RND transporter periplasmic adaptor subunit n=1 Tax=Jiulongibacter sediminis TaxID=1605367 RepID=UPI0026F0A2C2|nr:efflux RND transporter periplasmic adaptor subunit [Jiulongibacter sediminis]